MFTQTGQKVLRSKEPYLPPCLRTVIVEMEEGITSTSAAVKPGDADGKVYESYQEDEKTFNIDLTTDRPW